MKRITLLLSILILVTGCGDTPIFTDMKTSNLKVIIKGTFETDDISNFNSMPADADDPTMEDDSVDDNSSAGTDEVPTKLMLDIAEIRLNGKKFSNYRQVFEFGLDDSEDFFNGTGVTLKNDDPPEGNYDTVQLYIRKMIFNNAKIYEASGTGFVYEEEAEVIFHEEDVYGFDFNQLQINSYWDSLREEQGDILRTFPLEVSIPGGFTYEKDNDETVLEIRMVIKNFVKKFEYDYYDEGVYKVCHYYALSDWLRDVQAGEEYIGRNLHSVARAYVPETAGSLTVTTTTADQYVIAIPADEDIGDYSISDTGPNLRAASYSGYNCDLPAAPAWPGSYIEPVLDYYLKYEKYKYDFNNALGNCPDYDAYETWWDAYEAEVENFKIAPYVAFISGTGSHTFTNIAPGSYKVYRSSKPSYGEMFLDGAFTQIETTVTITAGGTESVSE